MPKPAASAPPVDVDPVPAPIAQVLAVFAELDDLRFGDLDSQALEALATDTREAASEVARLVAALDDAQAALAAHQAELHRRSEQALGYAKVYAADDDALAERLAAIKLGARAVTKAKAKAKARSPASSANAAGAKKSTRPARATQKSTQKGPAGPDDAPVVADAELEGGLRIAPDLEASAGAASAMP